MTVVTVSVTSRGATLAERLPYEHVHGSAAETVRTRWNTVDGFVLVLATGAAVRIIAPLLTDKASDPAVVCLDDQGAYAVALAGGHRRWGTDSGTGSGAGDVAGANSLARTVARLTGAKAVVTTASDVSGLAALDDLVGFDAEGDVATVTRAMLDGETPELVNELGWPLPPSLASLATGGSGSGRRFRVVVSDGEVRCPPGTVLLRPYSLVIGVGAASDAPAGEVRALVRTALGCSGLSEKSVAELATVDRRSQDAAVTALGWPVRSFTPEELAGVEVPHPSPVVESTLGTPSVAEAAALLAAGTGATLVQTKMKSRHATVAVARRARPPGKLSIVGLGPGGPAHRTPAAESAVKRAQLVIGYGPYVDQCADLLSPSQQVVRSPIGSEQERVRAAWAAASGGRRVALVCSGDPGVFAMASPALELAPGGGSADVEVVPGVTASLGAAAILGAPLGHDHASVSLSDLLTPWEVIARRLDALGGADLVVSLYNPRSSRRTWQLEEARRILLSHRGTQTPVGVVTDAGRPDEHVEVTTLGALDPSSVTMSSVVIVGCSTTRVVAGRMVTPRGYGADRAGTDREGGGT